MSTLKPKTKVVVRKLPPALTEEGFRQAVGTLLEELKYDWFSFYPGKVSLKRVIFARAYINFTTPEAVLEFKQAFDGHLFVGTKGNQYRCSVEYAPFQKIPVLSSKTDARDGTIVKDPDYLEFLKLLEEGPKALPSAAAQREAVEAQKRPAASATDEAEVVTPLMQFLQEKYSANPNMKLGGLKAKKKRDDAVGAGDAAKGALKSKQTSKLGETDSRSDASSLRSKDSHNSAATAAAAAAAPASKTSKQAKSKQEAAAPNVLLKTNSRQVVGTSKPSSTTEKGLPPKQAAARHSEPISRSSRADIKPARQTPNQPQHKEGTSQATTASETKQDRTSSTAAAESPGAAAPRMPIVPPPATSEGTTDDGAGQRTRKVRAGFQAYVPGALRSNRLQDNKDGG